MPSSRPDLTGSRAPPPGRLRYIAYPDRDSSGAAKDDRPRLLVVEDDYFAAIELEAGLLESGFEVVGIANTADEAVRLAQAERPLLALMDIRLAGMRDGVDAALEIFAAHGIRCIFTTAHHDAGTRIRAQHASPLGWLPKPYTLDSLLTLVRLAVAELKPKPS